MGQEFIILALGFAFAASAAQAMDHTGSFPRFNLAPADDASSVAAGSEEDDKVGLAKKLQNPVEYLISVPIQHNLDLGTGPTRSPCYSQNEGPLSASLGIAKTKQER